MEGVEIEYRSNEDDERNDNNDTPYDFVDEDNTAIVETPSDFVYEPRQAKPPQQCSAKDAQISHAHFHRMIGDDESKLSKQRHEKEHNKWIDECQPKGCQAIIYQCAFFLTAYVHVFGRIAAETIDTEGHEQNTAYDF